MGLLGTYLLLLFPDGRLPSAGGGAPWPGLRGAVICLSVAVILTPGPLADLGGVRNPFGLEGYPWLAAAQLFCPRCCPCACSPRP